MTESELLDEDFPQLEVEDTISKAFSLFRNWDSIILLDRGSYTGTITKKDLMRTKIQPEAKVGTYLFHPPVVDQEWEMGEVARLMVESGQYLVPVVHKDKVMGIINGDRILEKAAEGDFGNEPVEKFMTTELISVGPEDTISKAEGIMKEHQISRLPVIVDGKLIGLVSVNDLIDGIYHPEHRPRGTKSIGDMSKYGETVGEKKDYMKMPVKGIMSEVVETLPPGSPVRDVVKKFKEIGRGDLILAGGDGKLGIVTRTDLMKPIADYSKPGNFKIQFAGDLHEIPDFYRESARKEILDHLGMHEEYLRNTEIIVVLRLHKETMRGKQNTFCELRLTSPRGQFIVTDDGWGYKHAIRKATKALEKQIRRSRRD